MFYYDRIDAFEGLASDNTSASKEYNISYY